MTRQALSSCEKSENEVLAHQRQSTHICWMVLTVFQFRMVASTINAVDGCFTQALPETPLGSKNKVLCRGSGIDPACRASSPSF